MDDSKKIKENVKDRYSRIVEGKLTLNTTNKGSSCCGSKREAVLDMSAPYAADDRSAIPDGADLGLGCGTPAAFAGLTEGMTVLDLGSGAGIDCFVAAKHVGSSGHVIGVDMTPSMIDKANENKVKVGAANVEFRMGEIESLPVADNSVDRVISNCVINLVPDKGKAFREIFRVLRKGTGSFTVSDIVVDGDITEAERHDAALWAGCISGALRRGEYLAHIGNAGFADIAVISERRYDYALRQGGGIYSITVTARKP